MKHVIHFDYIYSYGGSTLTFFARNEKEAIKKFVAHMGKEYKKQITYIVQIV